MSAGCICTSFIQHNSPECDCRGNYIYPLWTRQTDHRNQAKLLLPAFSLYAMKGEKQWAQHKPFRGLQAVPLTAPVSMMLQCRSSMPGLVSPLPPQPWIFHRFIQPEPPNPPITHTHKVKLCLISSAATYLICTNPEHKWRHRSRFGDPRLEWMSMAQCTAWDNKKKIVEKKSDKKMTLFCAWKISVLEEIN